MSWRALSVWGVFASLVLATSCVAPPHLTLYRTDTEWVDLREPPAGYPSSGPYDHPYTLSPNRLRELLDTVRYRETMLFSFLLTSPRPVFTDYQLGLLSENLSNAFDQALPQEVVAFRVHEHEESDRYSQGIAFIKHHALHLIIQRLNALDIETPAAAPRPQTMHWELVPQNEQRLSIGPSRSGPLHAHGLLIPLRTKRAPHD